MLPTLVMGGYSRENLASFAPRCSSRAVAGTLARNGTTRLFITTNCRELTYATETHGH